MDTTLTTSQITSYRQNGYLAIENLLDASELATWRQAIDRAVDDTVSSNDSHHNQRDPDAYYSRVFVQCVNLWKTHDAVRELALDANLGRMAAELAGATGVRLYHDHALVKAPWANPTNFHVDNPMDPFYSPQSIMLWVALDDSTLQNGCLYFLPGSHESSRTDISGELGRAGIGDLIEDYPEWAGIEPQPVEGAAGAGIFISGMVAHAAGPNMTLAPRRAFALLYMPEDATFNGNKSALPDPVYQRLQVGDVIADDEYLPLLYSRGRE